MASRVSAAAGVLLAVSGMTGSICYATWALADRLVTGRLDPGPGIARPTPAVSQPLG